MKFKAVKPPHRRFASPGDFLEHWVAVNPSIVANGDGCGINKGQPRRSPFALLEVDTQGDQYRRPQGDKALIAHSSRKSPFEMISHIAQIIALEVTVMGLMEVNHDRHDLTERQMTRTPTPTLAIGQLLMLPMGQEALAEIIDITKQGF
jgi:hypothetical protein